MPLITALDFKLYPQQSSHIYSTESQVQEPPAPRGEMCTTSVPPSTTSFSPDSRKPLKRLGVMLPNVMRPVRVLFLLSTGGSCISGQWKIFTQGVLSIRPAHIAPRSLSSPPTLLPVYLLRRDAEAVRLSAVARRSELPSCNVMRATTGRG